MNKLTSILFILGGVASIVFRDWMTKEVMKTIEVSPQRQRVIKAYGPVTGVIFIVIGIVTLVQMLAK